MKFSIGRVFQAVIAFLLAGIFCLSTAAIAATLGDAESQADLSLALVQNSIEANVEGEIGQGLRDAREAARQALLALGGAAAPTRDQLNAAAGVARSVMAAARAGAKYASENNNTELAGEATLAADAGLNLLAELFAAAQGYGDVELAAGTAEGLDQLGETLKFAAIQARREKNTALSNQILGVVDRLIPQAESAALYNVGNAPIGLAVSAISALGNAAEAVTHLREATKGLANVRVQNAPGIRVKTITASLNRIRQAFGPNESGAVKEALVAARGQVGRNDFKFGRPGIKGKKGIDIVPASPI